MATDIVLTDLTNSSETGVFDVLMSAVNTHINNQYEAGRINGNDYANVYLGSVQAVLQQSVQYVLQEKVNEAQVDDILKDIDVKERTTKVQEDQSVVDTSYKSKQEKLVDSQIEGSNYDNQVKAQQVQESIIKVDQLLPAEVDKLTAEADHVVKSNDLIDLQLLGSEYDNKVKEEQALMSEYERTTVQPAKLAELEKGTEIKERQTVEQELTGVKQRDLLDIERKIAEQKIVGKVQSATAIIKD